MQPYRFSLDRQVVTLGRGEENDIAIDCGSVSLNHAEMRRVLGGYELVDVGSTNGIKLDGEKYDTIPLHTGADVTLGDVIFAFILSDDELATLHREMPGGTPPAPRQQVLVARTRSLTYGAILVFLFLAACFFFAGLALRHQMDTGTSLIHAIRENLSGKTNPAPVP